MASKIFKISELPEAIFSSTADLVADNPYQQETSGYKTYALEASEIADKMLNSFQYTQDMQTTDKTIVGAVNELETEIGRIGIAHISAGHGYYWNNPIFADPNVEIEVYESTGSGLREMYIDGQTLYIVVNEYDVDYTVEVIARYGLV